MRCPNCGEEAIKFVALTDAYFEVKPCKEGGFRPGRVLLDEDGIACIETSIRDEYNTDVEFKCEYCHSSFEAKQGDNGEYYIGTEI